MEDVHPILPDPALEASDEKRKGTAAMNIEVAKNCRHWVENQKEEELRSLRWQRMSEIWLMRGRVRQQSCV